MLAIPSTYVLLAIGAIVGAWVGWRIERDVNLGLRPSRTVYLMIYVLLSGQLGAMLYSWIETWPLPFTGDRTYYGAVIAVIALVLVLARCWRIKTASLLDLVVIAACFIGVWQRLGCLMNGCCQGVATSSLMGVRYPVAYDMLASPTMVDLLSGYRWKAYLALFHGERYVIPVSLYYSLGFLALGMVLYWNRRLIISAPGLIASIWFLAHGVMRFILELMRHNPPYVCSWLSLSGAVSIVSAAAGIVGIVMCCKRGHYRGVSAISDSATPASSNETVRRRIG